MNVEGGQQKSENELWRNVAKNVHRFDWRARLAFPTSSGTRAFEAASEITNALTLLLLGGQE